MIITGEGVIAGVVKLIASKAGEKLLGLRTNKRQQACRALTKLYFCVQTLDEVTDKLLDETAGCLPEHSRWIVNEFNNRSTDIELASNMFIDLGRELYEGLLIIDPALAQCCEALYVSKYDFLTFMSQPLDADEVGQRGVWSFRIPSEALVQWDLDSTYQEVSLRMNHGDEVYWPSSPLHDLWKDPVEMRISFERPDDAIQLRSIIAKHNLLLKEAKQGLRNLLKESFSVEELLYQSDTAPHRQL